MATRMNIKRFLATVVGVALTGGVACGPLGSSGHSSKSAVIQHSTCLEDQPCWDWRTMGNQTRGVCAVDVLLPNGQIGDEDRLEHINGTYTQGGRACEDAYEQNGSFAACENVTYALNARHHNLPVGWTLDCHEWAKDRGVTTLRFEGRPAGGLTVYAQKRIYLDTGSWHTDQELQGAAAHEVCHAQGFAGTRVQGRTSSDYLAEERAADACARAAGFIVPNHNAGG